MLCWHLLEQLDLLYQPQQIFVLVQTEQICVVLA